MPTFPSEDWLRSYKDAINASDEHKRAAADWEGDVSLVIEAEPEKGLEEHLYAWLDLWHGECREVKVVSIDEAERARFVIAAPYSRWKDVIRGKLEPIRGMREGKLRLAGDLPAITEYAQAADLLVRLAASIPTDFPDE